MAGLADIPFYGAYAARRQMNEQAPMQELQQASGALGLMGAIQQQRKAQAYEAAMGALPADATPEQRIDVAAKFASPDKLIGIQQDALNRKEAAAARAQQFQQTLDLKRDELERKRSEFEQRTADANQRLQFDQWYRGQMLVLQQQNAALAAEMKRLGLQNQADQKARVADQDIERQIGKTADRMKDVQPVWTAAQQLNGLLSRYTPDDIPGVGYAKNTDLGKALLTEEGKDVSSSIKLFGNSVLKAMSGAAVTAPEEIRQMAAQMADGRFGAKDFYIAWPKMAEWVNDQVRLSTAGLTPQARERYIERTGLKIDPIAPRFAFTNGQLVDTKAPKPAAGPAGLPPLPPGFNLDQ